MNDHITAEELDGLEVLEKSLPPALQWSRGVGFERSEQMYCIRNVLPRLIAEVRRLHMVSISAIEDELYLVALKEQIKKAEAERSWLAERIAKKECYDPRNCWRDVRNPIFTCKYWLEQAQEATKRGEV